MRVSDRSRLFGVKETEWWADFEARFGARPMEQKLATAWRAGYKAGKRDAMKLAKEKVKK